VGPVGPVIAKGLGNIIVCAKVSFGRARKDENILRKLNEGE